MPPKIAYFVLQSFSVTPTPVNERTLHFVTAFSRAVGAIAVGRLRIYEQTREKGNMRLGALLGYEMITYFSSTLISASFLSASAARNCNSADAPAAIRRMWFFRARRAPASTRLSARQTDSWWER